MYTALWLLCDLLFVLFVVMHLFAKRKMQMLRYEGVQEKDRLEKVNGQIRLYRTLWIVCLVAMFGTLFLMLPR